MDQTALQQSHLVESVAGALGRLTVERHAERDPTLAQRYGPAWRKRWTSAVGARLQHLAQALAVRRPAVLAQHLSWSRAAGVARNVGEDDLKTSVQCMREVLADELPESASAACLRCLDEAIDAQAGLPGDPGSYLDATNPHYDLLLRFLEAVLDSRPDDAEQAALAATEGGVLAPDVYSRVLQPALMEVGRLWQLGEITVADEHLATVTVERVMSRLRPRFKRGGRRNRTLLATSVSGDLHAIGVRMVADFFAMDGWDALCLGANTPADDVLEMLRASSADLLAASTCSLLHLRELGALIAAVRAAPDLADLPVLVGGAAFNTIPDLWREIGADGSASSAAAAVDVGNRLVT